MVRNDYLKEATYTARQEENCVKLYNVRHFDLPSTFENGQCFRWERMDSDRYIGVAKGKVLEVKKDGDLYLFYNTNLQEFEKVWVPYFTLDIDYDKVIKVLSKDPLLEKAIAFAPGLRLLRQDFHETLISFILSSNNNIQRIKKIIGNLCQAAGKDIRYNGKIYKTFPSIRDMKHLTCRDFLDMGAGYRSKYLEHTIQRLCCEDIDASFLRTCSLDQARKTLQQYMGIGFNTTTAWIVEQLGLAMIPLWFSKAVGLTSGTTKGTPGSILHALLLSTTMQPFEAAIGAKILLLDAPAENNAISNPLSKEVSVNSSTITVLPLNCISLPFDLAEAKTAISSIGKSLSSSTFNMVLPTIPVAPTTANLIFFIAPSNYIHFIICANDKMFK
jgi:N-glycosylase/DNA lyase